MILILSSNQDSSTNKVIDWLQNLNKKWVRINDSEAIKVSITINNDQTSILLKQMGISIDLDDITSYWYRKGNFNFEWEIPLPMRSHPFLKEIHRHLSNDVRVLQDFIHFALQSKKGIGDYLMAEPNKLNTLLLAKKAGFKIPTTVVTNETPYNFNDAPNQKWITKAIWEALHGFSEEHGVLKSYTSEVDFTKHSFSNFPSLFQHSIDKEFELRVFYLDKVCYCMAIFSQADAQTIIDFRNYNDSNPNRTVPYNLPPHVSKQIEILMKSLGLISGSIDLIRTTNDAYVFLEVNPVGQFGMISHPCNYHLEKEIAIAL